MTIFLIYSLIALPAMEINKAHSTQDRRFIFSEFDGLLISLWANKESNSALLQSELSKVNFEWKKIKDSNTLDKNPNLKAYIQQVDMYQSSLLDCVSDRHSGQVKEHVFKILWAGKNLRSVEGINYYPLDILWNILYEHDQIHRTVHDQMFGLKDWSEFEDMVFDLTDLWIDYKTFPYLDIKKFFPKMEEQKHQQIKTELTQCLDKLIDSLESGYQTDYELPCDEFGIALNKLLGLYGI